MNPSFRYRASLLLSFIAALLIIFFSLVSYAYGYRYGIYLLLFLPALILRIFSEAKTKKRWVDFYILILLLLSFVLKEYFHTSGIVSILYVVSLIARLLSVTVPLYLLAEDFVSPSASFTARGAGEVRDNLIQSTGASPVGVFRYRLSLFLSFIALPVSFIPLLLLSGGGGGFGGILILLLSAVILSLCLISSLILRILSEARTKKRWVDFYILILLLLLSALSASVNGSITPIILITLIFVVTPLYLLTEDFISSATTRYLFYFIISVATLFLALLALNYF